MNTQLMILAIVMLVAGIASIATSAIGIQAYNAQASLKVDHPSNYKYLVTNLILAIFLVLGSFATFYYASKVPNFSADALSGKFDSALNAARNA
uniref:VP11 n=1 Tax=viral metagenome TaxID=1070528 RepID=A0A6C0KHH3_9ZZZZ